MSLDQPFIPGLVSVIMPAFNRAHLIERALDSVLCQSYRPIELVVVDDGSSDDTVSVVEHWKRAITEAGFQVVVVNQANRGAPSARNHGLRLSRGEFIQFLDSDDIIASEKIRTQVEALIQKEAQIAWSGVKVVKDYDNVQELASCIPSRSFVKLSEVPTAVSRCLFRREACLAIGSWNEELIRHQDWEYSVRAANRGFSIIASQDPFHIHVEHRGPRINDIDKDPEAALQSCLAAIVSAERATAPHRSWPAREPLGRKSLSTLLAALALGDRDTARLAMSKIRDHLPVFDFGRLKAELLMLAAATWQPLAARLSRSAMSRQSHASVSN